MESFPQSISSLSQHSPAKSYKFIIKLIYWFSLSASCSSEFSSMVGRYGEVRCLARSFAASTGPTAGTISSSKMADDEMCSRKEASSVIWLPMTSRLSPGCLCRCSATRWSDGIRSRISFYSLFISVHSFSCLYLHYCKFKG